ncbi:SH3 beta-barrel fold-containing protein [bacterium]|nr:SH3 beta-barrel fold-containing protein [bacterium]
MFTRDKIEEALRANVAEVRFTKSDGTERIMKCTLREDLVTVYQKKTDRVKEKNLDVVPVFDVEKNEWRSFRVDSVQSISVWGGQE